MNMRSKVWAEQADPDIFLLPQTWLTHILISVIITKPCFASSTKEGGGLAGAKHPAVIHLTYQARPLRVAEHSVFFLFLL